jgi:hypothetical protein
MWCVFLPSSAVNVRRAAQPYEAHEGMVRFFMKTAAAAVAGTCR